MKTKLFAALLCSAAALGAAPLTETTAVFAQPDLAAAPIAYLKAGTEPPAAADSLATAPAGWMAVDLPGPFECYVANGDLTKDLDVRPGAPVYLEPKPGAAVLTTAAKGDKIGITGFRGKWTQISLDRKIAGFIRTAPAPLPPIATAPAATAAASPAPAPVGTSPDGAAAAPGKPAPSAGDAGAVASPRLFQGRLVSTRRPFAPRRPYDYQLNDDAGMRFAYLDFSRLLQTEQIESYVGRTVVVYGTAGNVPEAKGIVIQVESLELK